MPPTRTIPPAKAIKTERTHEENQERAYIAASRRSDRSLEARVESARRASEIHKRRTGRSLRVTEQDVINEEMYEEEDDDLPLAYRRLTAHLQTNSVDFNQRLNAYITNQVAMRSALERSIAINNMNGSTDWLNGQQMTNGQMSMFPSPMLAHQNQRSMHSPKSPTSYRQAPYPTPSPRTQQSFPEPQHRRSASIAQDTAQSSRNSPTSTSQNDRRMSLPVKRESTDSPLEQSPTPQSATTALPNQSFNQANTQQEQKPSFDAGTFNNLNYPFSLALPAESQMLLGNTLNTSSNPLIANMMAGSSNLPQYDFDYNQNQSWSSSSGTDSKQGLPPNYNGGLNDTLAPSTFDQNSLNWNYGQAGDLFGAKDSNAGSLTPGLNGESWGSFIDTDQWDVQEGALEA